MEGMRQTRSRGWEGGVIQQEWSDLPDLPASTVEGVLEWRFLYC